MGVSFLFLNALLRPLVKLYKLMHIKSFFQMHIAFWKNDYLKTPNGIFKAKKIWTIFLSVGQINGTTQNLLDSRWFNCRRKNGTCFLGQKKSQLASQNFIPSWYVNVATSYYMLLYVFCPFLDDVPWNWYIITKSVTPILLLLINIDYLY